MNRKEWDRQSRSHAASARSLLRTGNFDAAYYLAGLAVECALKARIAGRFRANDIPDLKLVRDVYQHDLVALVRLAGLRDALALERQRDPTVDGYWNTMTTWSMDSRYAAWSKDEATAMVEAATERATGVLSCIRRL